MSEKHYVVIGSGPAGTQAGLTLREHAPSSRITIITKSRESGYAPYLLPSFIAGRIKEEDLFVCSYDTYKEHGIKLRCCQKVVDLNLSSNQIILGHKEIISFDGLIIAVGAKPRIPEQLAVYEDLMFTLRDLAEARAWREMLPQTDSVLLIGGDLISLAVAKALIPLRKKIYFMLNEDAFWPLRCNEEMFDNVGNILARKGVEVLKGRTVKSLSRLADGTYEVQMDDGALLVGMVGAFFGLVPDVRFLARSGLKIDRGILVDEHLHTGFDNVYATGDCAQIYHPELRDYWISVGHENARRLGYIAARNLVGGDKRTEVKPKSIFAVEGINVNTSWWSEF